MKFYNLISIKRLRFSAFSDSDKPRMLQLLAYKHYELEKVHAQLI